MTQASITIHDVNDSPPTFNKKNYFISLAENTPVGTPLPIEMSVRDPDVGQNAVFDLRLEDVSGVFDIEPKHVTGSTQISIRVANGTLDYENPNQRKFIVLVSSPRSFSLTKFSEYLLNACSKQIVAEETKTPQKLSSTATLTVTVTDANDNRPIFEHESYSFSVSETAPSGHLIGTIIAKDLDSGRFGSNGIRYSLSGTGANLFDVNEKSGAISVATCPSAENRNRQKRQVSSAEQQPNAKKVNLTIVGETGFIDVDDTSSTMLDDSTTEIYFPYNEPHSSDEQLTFRQFFNIGDDYMVMSDSGEETTTVGSSSERSIDDEHVVMRRVLAEDTGPGHAPCLDYETQSVYFLSYKVCSACNLFMRQKSFSHDPHSIHRPPTIMVLDKHP